MITPGPFQDAVAHVAAQEIAQAVEDAIGKVAEKFKVSPEEVRECLAVCAACETKGAA